MRRLSGIRAFLSAHDVGGLWLAASLSCWTLAAFGTALIVPQLATDRPPDLGPFDNFLFPLMAAAAGVFASRIHPDPRALHRATARRLRGWTVTWAALLWAAGALPAVAVATSRLGQHNTPHALYAWTALFAVAGIADCWSGRMTAVAAPLAIVVPLSVTSIVPWSSNALYNTALTNDLAIATGLATLALLVAIWAATRR